MSNTEPGDAEVATPKRAMPTYPMEKVDALPEDAANATGGRSNLFLGLLEKVATDPGEWYCIASYKTASGAPNALKEIRTGNREVPQGEFEFETRKVANPEGRGPKHSKLFARFLG